jgi:DNA-directed RNA polymerase sigma subunit (sigma70/sigma32)
MRDISKFKTLSREEEIDIFIEYQRGEPGKKQEIINCNLKLVVYLANKKFSHLFNIVNPMDLIQE